MLAEPGHQSLRDLHAYWLSKKGSAIAPPRTAIDPAEILPLLPNVALIDVIGHPPRFRFRLFGTALAAAYGQDVTGQFLDQIDLDDLAAEIVEQMETVVRDQCVIITRDRYTKRLDGRHVQYVRIALPLSNDGETVNMILCGFAVEKAYNCCGQCRTRSQAENPYID